MPAVVETARRLGSGISGAQGPDIMGGQAGIYSTDLYAPAEREVPEEYGVRNLSETGLGLTQPHEAIPPFSASVMEGKKNKRASQRFTESASASASARYELPLVRLRVASTLNHTGKQFTRHQRYLLGPRTRVLGTL